MILITPQTRAQLQAVARVVLLSRRGTLSEQITRSQYPEPAGALRCEVCSLDQARRCRQYRSQHLQYFNGLGGFSENGREYTVVLSEGLRTPEPWINVIANPDFGFLVSESGSGFTWSLNSHENQITPWSNDHVIDPAGEAIYLRDESTGESMDSHGSADSAGRRQPTWRATARATAASLHGSHGISVDLVQFVRRRRLRSKFHDSPCEMIRSARRISVTAYVEWILGSSRSATAPYVVTEIDSKSGAIFARSMWAG